MKKPEKPKRSVLGRGLDALLPDVSIAETSDPAFFQCGVEMLRPNRFQPRKRFEEEDLRELADSITRQGLIQPLVVRRSNGGYEIVAGERRLRAARLAGLETVPVVLRDVSDEEMLLMAIVENIQRENLNPMEECEGYHRLVSEFACTQEQVAAKVGKPRSTVANFLRLKNLPSQIQDSLRDSVITMGHARALLGLENRARQMLAWKTVCSKGLSVRATEELVDKLKSDLPKTEPAQPKKPGDIHLASIADELSRSLGAKVQIKRKGKRGVLSIEFYADKDLERLLAILGLSGS